MHKFFDNDAEAMFNRLSDPLIKPRVTKGWIEHKEFDKRMSQTYGTKELAEKVTDPASEFYKDYRLPWLYSNCRSDGRTLDMWEVYEMSDWICPIFKVPYDWRRGLNDFINRVDLSTKDQTMNGSELYKPSIEHIVPWTLGGPKSDIRNIMIIPLAINKMLTNSTPRERMVFLKGCSSRSFVDRVEEAERLFYQ